MEKQNYITVNGASIFYSVYGSGKPVILLHGGRSTGNIAFEKLIPILEDKFMVYVPDARGHGRSSNPAGFLSYRQMAEDYIAFIKELHIEKPTIIGWSDGGQVILEMILIDSTVAKFITYGTLATATQEFLDHMKFLLPALEESTSDEWYVKIWGDYIEIMKKEFGYVYGEEYYKEYFRQMVKMWLDADAYPGSKLDGKSADLIIVHGDRDQAVPLEQAFNIYKMVKDSQLLVIPNANHLIPLYDAKRFYYYIQEFL